MTGAGNRKGIKDPGPRSTREGAGGSRRSNFSSYFLVTYKCFDPFALLRSHIAGTVPFQLILTSRCNLDKWITDLYPNA